MKIYMLIASRSETATHMDGESLVVEDGLGYELPVAVYLDKQTALRIGLHSGYTVVSANILDWPVAKELEAGSEVVPQPEVKVFPPFWATQKAKA